jgi:PhnB protein
MPSKTKRAKRSESTKTNAIPPGFHTVTPYLTLNGAADALEFYKKAFEAKELARETTPDGKVIHGRVRIGDSIIMMSDEFPGSDTKSPKSIGGTTGTLHIYSKNVDSLWQRAVSAGAKVAMPLDNQFWGERYGQLVDPFGHRWSLSMRIKMSPKEMEAKRQAAMAMFAQGEHPGKIE